jgi:hypothetical protein
LFAEHRRALQSFFYRRIRTKSDAPDLAQEVYVRMLRVSDTDAIRNPQLYLYTVASNLVKEHAVLDRWQTRGVNLDSVGDAHVLAVGTQFDVYRRLDATVVTVVRACGRRTCAAIAAAGLAAGCSCALTQGVYRLNLSRSTCGRLWPGSNAR